MCNYLHKDSVTPRKKNGRAWKVVAMRGDKMLGLVSQVGYDFSHNEGWVQWNSFFSGDGFAVLPQLKEAKHVQRIWEDNTEPLQGQTNKIIRVEYKEAIGRHLERRFHSPATPIDMLLVKQWRQI